MVTIPQPPAGTKAAMARRRWAGFDAGEWLSVRRSWPFVAAGLLAACGSDTHTPDACPPQATYDIRELYAPENREDPDIALARRRAEAQVAAAAAKGCLTEPTDIPPYKQIANAKPDRGSQRQTDAGRADAGSE